MATSASATVLLVLDLVRLLAGLLTRPPDIGPPPRPDHQRDLRKRYHRNDTSPHR